MLYLNVSYKNGLNTTTVIVMSVCSSCGRQVPKVSVETGDSYQLFSSESQRRRSGTYSYI